ncbi:MAG: peptidylprolyl isomerase [Bacteroidales bacterium]|nr:peptidylprolyl isomerase [Bacteroidales bacterium]MCM1147527.1 peptidylprolyl isomerase [Bacteroidales bacterium]MCM1206196.1 peptidylprolyl isomerase [Bacillota bacterium]MCM1509970.1 peptidylprolyl isomerase [Clostridium sp.]
MIICLLFTALSLPVSAQKENDSRTKVIIETTLGRIKVVLYDETPLHKENFKSLVNQGFYDGLLFHRVINKFMIQSGDPASRTAIPGESLGDTPEPYTIPAEIRYPGIMHKRGALCMARESDSVNPQRASSAYQFYIVYVTRFDDDMLDRVQARLKVSGNDNVVLVPDVRDVYRRIGGTPHLDGQYTVFGEVVEGMDVVRDIQWVDTDNNDRPLKDVRIIKAYEVKEE